MTVSANSIVQHVIKTKNGITKHVNVSIKIMISAKETVAGILAHVSVRIASI